MCATFVGHLRVYWAPLPMVILGVPAVIAGFLTIVLPETSGKELIETSEKAGREDRRREIQPLQLTGHKD